MSARADAPRTEVTGLLQAWRGGESAGEERVLAIVYAELQGLVANLYGLSESEFVHVLSTFPLIADDVKSAALVQFNNFH